VQSALIISWSITAIAIGIAISFASTPTVLAPTPPMSATTSNQLSTLRNEITELERLLNDAQSALADRDREIAHAMAELSARPSTSTTDIATYIHQLQQRGIRADTLKNNDQILGVIIIDHLDAGLVLLTKTLTPPAEPAMVGLWIAPAHLPATRLATCGELFTTFALPKSWNPGNAFHLCADDGVTAGAVLGSAQLSPSVQTKDK
jgi:hypothetical protein